MPQKVITAVVRAHVNKENFAELEFPQLKTALDEGYFIKEIHQSVIQAEQNTTVGYVTLTFFLDR